MVCSHWVCVHCGESISAEEVKGSTKHPHCAECFEKVWHNDDEAYYNWLRKRIADRIFNYEIHRAAKKQLGLPLGFIP